MPRQTRRTYLAYDENKEEFAEEFAEELAKNRRTRQRTVMWAIFFVVVIIAIFVMLFVTLYKPEKPPPKEPENESTEEMGRNILQDKWDAAHKPPNWEDDGWSAEKWKSYFFAVRTSTEDPTGEILYQSSNEYDYKQKLVGKAKLVDTNASLSNSRHVELFFKDGDSSRLSDDDGSGGGTTVNNYNRGGGYYHYGGLYHSPWGYSVYRDPVVSTTTSVNKRTYVKRQNYTTSSRTSRRGSGGSGGCFAADVRVLVENGNATMRIADVGLGTVLQDKSVVIGILKLQNDDMYRLDGIDVSCDHPVYWQGKWRRPNSVDAATPLEGEYDVYNLITTSHRIPVQGNTRRWLFTDYDEIDDTAHKLEYNLDVLNHNLVGRTITYIPQHMCT